MGRPKGSPNKITASVKASLEKAYQALGDDEAFIEWAKANPTLFYKDMWNKMLPQDQNYNHTGLVKVNGTINFVRPRPRD